MTLPRTLFFDRLFTGESWLEAARVEIGGEGEITALRDGASAGGSERFRGCAVPGIPNLHSHAHQRAMAGLAERSGDRQDSFWTWREVMYRHVAAMSPEQLEAISAQLYVEMLEAGYTAVGEFQYLHHDPRGRPYGRLAEMTLRTLEAARRVGLGITCLPVLYAHGGFGGEAPGEGQKRFLNGAGRFLRLVEELQGATAADPSAAVGIAPHSLRAVTAELMEDVLRGFGAAGPIHIHVAEQRREVEECLAWSGRRPVEWLLDRFAVDESWCLIHATHMTSEETRAMAGSGAVAGLCPVTEANLGDGFFNAGEFLGAGGRVGIGSDSHISVSPVEELRWLEYGQRLIRGGRNVLADAARRSTGRALLEAALAGGARACGRKIGRIAPGYRADLVVLDTEHPLLAERRQDEILDSWIFSGNAPLVREVIVGGRTVVEDGRHRRRREVARDFRRTLESLRSRTGQD